MMTGPEPTLYLLAGKICAGKSTLAAQLADRPNCVLISEDHWLSSLYPGEIKSLADYVRCAGQLRAAMKPHVLALLDAGLSIVMDFPANTPKQRVWLRGLFEAGGVAHELHHVDVPDETCKRRLRARNRSGDHAFQTSEADFDLVTSYFVVPSADEGFHIKTHRGE